MAIQNIETGYKPEFGLGALFSGWNAGNTMRSNEEEILRQILANKQKEQEMPHELAMKQYEGALANAKLASPDYIPKALLGYIGQMNSQQAAGDRAMQTLDSSVAAGNAENLNKAGEEDLFRRIRDLQLTGTGGSIGFGKGTAQPQEGDGNLGLFQDVMNNPDLTPEQKNLVYADAEQSGMLNQTQGLIDRFMKIATDTPPHRQKMALGEQKGLFGLQNTQMRTQAQIANMKERIANLKTKSPSLSQQDAQAIAIYSGQIPGDVDAADRYLQMRIFMDINKSGTNQRDQGYDLSEQTGLTKVPSVAKSTPKPESVKDAQRKYDAKEQARIREEGIARRAAASQGTTTSGVKFTVKKTGE